MGLRQSKRLRAFIGLGLLLVFTLFSVGCGNEVATVNGEKIPQKEFDKYLSISQKSYEAEGMDFTTSPELLQTLKGFVLDQLINEYVLIQEARRQGLAVTTEEVQQRIEEDKLSVGGEANYLEILKNQLNMTETEYKAVVEKELLMNKLYEQVGANQTVTDADAEAYYQANTQEFNELEQVRAQHILVATEEEGKAILAELNAGADFAQLAVDKSTDPSVAQNKGDMGYFSMEDSFVQEFKDAAFALQPGQITPTPVKTQFGFHIIKVDDRKPARQLTFEEAKPDILNQLKETRKSEAFQTFFEELLAKATIEKTEFKTEQTPAQNQVPATNQTPNPDPTPVPDAGIQVDPNAADPGSATPPATTP